MNLAALHTPGDYSKGLLAIAPGAGNAPAPGASIDRTGYLSAIADVSFAFSGAPTGGTVTLQFQDSADGQTFVNFGAPIAAPVVAGNAAGGLASLPIDLGGARQFVRLSVVAAPAGGNAPAATLAATVRLFGPDRLPAL
ncbi:MAG: hypothetical protein ACRYGP_13835 [Janthinobacterium lividum]